jgi:hypothetical protein
VVAAGVVLLLDDGGSDHAAAAPGTLAGATVLGSDLSHEGTLQDCRARAVMPRSPGCTIAQARLPGRRVVVPAPGRVRRWAVRSARGELALSVLRPRDGGLFQIELSRGEFVDDGRVHVFNTDLAVERGDVLSLRLVPGSGIGTRPAAGATTNRWLPSLRARRVPDLGAGTGLDREVLFRAELMPGEQRLPRQVTGEAAARLPAGRVLRRARARFARRAPLDLALVAVGGGVAMDLASGGVRLARLDMPTFIAPRGRVVTFSVVPGDPKAPPFVELFIEWANEDSARILSHYFVAHAREFEFVN